MTTTEVSNPLTPTAIGETAMNIATRTQDTTRDLTPEADVTQTLYQLTPPRMGVTHVIVSEAVMHESGEVEVMVFGSQHDGEPLIDIRELAYLPGSHTDAAALAEIDYAIGETP